MKPELLHILQHSLGLDQYGRGEKYRNNFVTGPGSKDFDQCNELVAAGFMKDHGAREGMSGSHLFTVTDAGVKAMYEASPKPPKISKAKQRYLDYLNVADCFNSFRDWLLYREEKRKEYPFSFDL